MFEESEIINLIAVALSVFILLTYFRRKDLPGLRLLVPGFLAIMAGNVFTVVEGVFWEGLFNLLEHLSYALAGILFALGTWSLLKHRPGEEEL